MVNKRMIALKIDQPLTILRNKLLFGYIVTENIAVLLPKTLY